jgi:L-threonylcarbamoyladenylate synthase
MLNLKSIGAAVDRMKVTDPAALRCAVAALDAGCVIVVPTARWYMFVARADDESASPAIFRLKRRAPDKSLLLIAPSLDWAISAFMFSSGARQLADAFWPGDLSLRLRWHNPAVGYSAVGVPVGLVGLAAGSLGEIAAEVGSPLVSTSVNFSGTPTEGGTQPHFAFEQVVEMMSDHPESGRVAIALDGGVCPLVEATTVIDCASSGPPVLERPGAVHLDALLFVTPDLDITRMRRDMDGFVR